jgi:hypothetical protein
MMAISLRRLCDVCINVVLICLLALVLGSRGAEGALPMVSKVSKQPLMVHVDRLMRALAFVGHPISDADRAQIEAAAQEPDAVAIQKQWAHFSKRKM